jgi:hypothetical protein
MTPPAQPLNVLWLIDHVCYGGSLHGGGRHDAGPLRKPALQLGAPGRGHGYGRPHVVPALGEPLELVQRYGGGLTVPAGDADAVAQAILSIGNDRLLRAELGRKARVGAEDLTVDAATTRLTRLYQLLHEARRGAMAADPRS